MPGVEVWKKNKLWIVKVDSIPGVEVLEINKVWIVKV